MEPKATNRLSTEETFVLRKLYKDDVFPQFGPKHIDYWYGQRLYGRIDRSENIVTPKTDQLKQLLTDRGTHVALNFVVDSFESMRGAFQQGLIRNTMRANGSPYSALRVRRAMEDPADMYLAYLNAVDELFVTDYLFKRGLVKTIRSFDEYMQHYLRYIKDRIDLFPMTKTGFVASKFCSPLCTGLVIEINGEDHSSDMPKKDNYLMDQNFEIARNTAEQFGFMMDKNAPWRFTADLASPFIQRHAEKYGVKESPGSASNIFDTHYDLVYNDDIKLLKRFFLSSYGSFTTTFPNYREESLEYDNGEPSITIKQGQRQAYSAATYREKYKDPFWFNLYASLRLREARVPLTNERRSVILKKVNSLLKYGGPIRTLKVINETVLSSSPTRWWMEETAGDQESQTVDTQPTADGDTQGY